jgi:predicted nucleotidyltransferase
MDVVGLQNLDFLEDRAPFRRIFITVSGAHLYGFPSVDSDVDLRGVYLLPLAAVIGMRHPEETLSLSFIQEGREIDLVYHDLRKYLGLLLGKNGYVLEQLYSPLVIEGGVAFEELRALGRGTITRQVYYHYAGFAHNQRRLLEKESPPVVKTLLYIYRVLLTGIHLLRSGEVESNLVHLNAEFRVPGVDELIERKRQAEKIELAAEELVRHGKRLDRLLRKLQGAFEASTLPEGPDPATAAALEDYLIRLRLEAQ